MTRRLLLCLPAGWLLSAQAGRFHPGENRVPLRGTAQEVHFYPARDGAARPCVLFAPGDGGWRGFAVTVAEQAVSWGYDVYGLDTRQYLESFTSAGKRLTEGDVARDVATLADAVRQDRPAILLGWSEGAGLMTIAASDESKARYAGLITLGLGDQNVLAWRFADNFGFLTSGRAAEPTFSSCAYLPRVAPLPLVMLQSTGDEYVPPQEASRLFQAAREPKRLFTVPARNHRFDGAHEEFFQRLREGLSWVAASAPK